RPRPAGWFVAGALLGSLPSWVYEAVYFPATRLEVYGGGHAAAPPVLARAITILGTHVPDTLGVPERGALQTVTLVVSAALVLLGLGVAWRWDRGEVRWSLGLGGAPAGGRVLLWILLVTNLALVLVSPQGAAGSRYLHPLYSVLPSVTGIALAWLWRRRRALGVVAAAALLAIHAWHTWAHGPGTPPARWRWRPTVRRLEPLLAWLEARGIHHAYWAFRQLPPSYEMTYLARGRVVFADPWRELVLAHARQVDASPA